VKKSTAPLGNHQKCWLWGRIAVTETLAAGRWPVLELLLSDALGDDKISTARDQAHALATPVSVVSKSKLTRLARTDHHQGYLAKMGQYPYVDWRDILDLCDAKTSSNPLMIILDGIQDPQNLGAIIRSTEVFGAGGVFISAANQVPITTAVARSSAGAVNRVNIARCDLPALASEMTQSGFKTIAACETAEDSLYNCDLAGPVTIVIGNEARGIRPELLELCSYRVSIEQHGEINSLNAATAASIFMYEARRHCNVH